MESADVPPIDRPLAKTYIVGYKRPDRINGGYLPLFHWSIVVYFHGYPQTKPYSFEVHEVRGSRGFYIYEREGHSDENSSTSMVDQICIGRCPMENVKDMREVLREVDVVNISPEQEWSSRNWCLDALDALKTAGFGDRFVTRDYFKDWMAQGELEHAKELARPH